MKRSPLLLGLILLCFKSSLAFAFPEMVRHNYVNCSSCHVSPNGGGVLNAYGRQSAAAVLSTWGSENEAKPFYGAFNQPDWIDSAAFIRTVQTFQDNSRVSSGYFWWMQGDLEGAVKIGSEGKWTVDMSLGINPDVLNGLLPGGASPLTSRRHYLMYRPSDTTSIRAGRFLMDYGIYFPEHSIATRQGIGIDEGNETYNLEGSYQGESWSGSLTANLGRPDNVSLMAETGGSASGALHLSDHDTLGWSVYYGTQNGNSRQLTGPHLLLGLSPHFYILGEADLQWTQSAEGRSTQGFFSYERIGYELIQGLHLYVMQQTFVHSTSGAYQPLPQQLKYGPIPNRLNGIGPGIYWFPRPHFYFQAEVQQQYSGNLPSAQTYGFITGNLYL